MYIEPKLWKLIQASKALLNKMEEITNSEEWRGVFVLAHAHGMGYTGDDWADEYNALKEMVEELEREDQDG